MIDMKLSEVEKKDLIVPEPPKYPYGLRLRLGPEEIEKLNLSDPQVGAEFILNAKVEIVEVEIAEEKGDDKSYNISLQVKDMELKKESEEKPSDAQVIYGS